MTQNETILNALKRGPLTPLAAIVGHGCMRLASRVYDLRQQGYTIHAERYETPSGKHVARYRLVA